MPEGSILRTLHRKQSFLGEASSLGIKYFLVRASTLDSLDIFQKWMTQGTLELTSGCASDIVGSVDSLICQLPRSLILQATPENFFDRASLTGLQIQDVMYNTASRLNRATGPQIWAHWGEQAARFPWTAEETKQLLKQGYMEDWRSDIEMLKQGGSAA